MERNMSRPGESNGVPVGSSAMRHDEINLQQLLRERLAILSGGRDRQGGAIITFPASSSALESVKLDDLRALMTYLTSIPSDEVRRHGYTIIVDIRSPRANNVNVKALLKSLQDIFPCRIRGVFIVKPDGCKSKSTPISSKYTFEVSWISVDQLPRSINTSQLTPDLGGSLHYNHNEWVEVKGIIDEFIERASTMLDHLDNVKRGLLSGELPHDLTTADNMLKEHQRLKKTLVTVPVEALEERGQTILSRLSSRSDSYPPASLNGSIHSIAQNPDFQPLLGHVRQLLDRLHNIRGQLHQACQHRQNQLEHSRQLRAFQQQAETMLEGINARRQQFLLSYTEIGVSYAAVRELQQKHEQFQLNCMEMFLEIDRILQLASKLMESGHYASDVVRSDAGKLDHERKAFGAGLKDRTAVLSLSATFHRKAEDFIRNAPAWMTACKIDPTPNEETDLDALIDQHDFVKKSIAEAYTEVHSCSKMLMHHLNRLITFCRRTLSDHVCADGKAVLDAMHGSGDSTANDSVTSKADYTKGATHVLDVIHKILNQYRQLQQQSEEKQSVLESQWSVRQFQYDVRQVIDWIKIHGNPFLAKNSETGRSSQEAKNLRVCHLHFERVAKNTYTNADKLLNAAEQLKLKGSGTRAEDVQTAAGDLQRHTKEFADRVSGRRSVLETSIAFYEHLENLSAYLEQAKKSLRVDPPLESLEFVVESLNRLNNERQAVMECCTHTDREGYALLNQLKELSLTESQDFRHIDATLRHIAGTREELEAVWEPRRIKLDVYLKLRMFERSASEVISDADHWADSIQDNDLDLDVHNAKLELNNLESRVVQLLTLSEQAYARGQELLQYLDNFNSSPSAMENLQTIKQRVTSLLDFLADRQSEIPDIGEIYRIRLQNVIQLNVCNAKAQEISTYIQSRLAALKSLPLSLKSLHEAEILLKNHEDIRVDVEKLGSIVMQFQANAENIVQNDIDGAEIATRLMEGVNAKWQQLVHYSDDLHRAISQGITFYRAADQVRAVLGTLEKEYRHDEDWCGGDKSHRSDKVVWIAQLVHRHQEQKEAFMKACTHVRRTGETFMKALGRAYAQCPTMDATSLRSTEGQVRGLLGQVQGLEDGVLQLWTRRKKRFDHCQQYTLVERSARQALAWIQDTGELYLSTHTNVGDSQKATETLLQEHREFLYTAKENKEKIRLLMQLADSLVESGHSHAASIKAWVSAVDSRQKDFMARMENYQQQLEHKLGVVLNGKDTQSQADRNSDASLEGKLQDITVKGTSAEERKTLREREGAMSELLQTEKTYVKDLADCLKCYLLELKQPTLGIVPPAGLADHIPVIFGNIEEIYAFHSSVFLKELEKYESVPEDVAHCFMTWSSKFDMYVTYCMNNRLAQNAIAEGPARDYFAEVGARLGLNSSSTMNSYIIKPVQRTVKYGQLLERLSFCCEDSRGEIRDALDVVRNVTQKANDASNLSLVEGYSESMDKLGEIILVDSLQAWEPKQIFRKGRKYQVFLFERVLLFTKEIKDANGHKKFVFKNKYMTAGMSIQENVEGGDELKFAIWMGRMSSGNQNSNNQSTGSSADSKLILKASSLPVKLNWIQKLRENVTDNNCVTSSPSPTTVAPTSGTNLKDRRNSRGCKDYEDCLSLEEGAPGSSHERYSTISHSSSNTTDSSDKVLYEGDWATITENYQAIHDGELSVSKGECVEIVDRSSSADTYYVRLRITPSNASHKVAVASGQKILEGYLPATVLTLVPSNRSVRPPSPSRTVSMDQRNDDVFGSSSTVSLQSSHNSSSGSTAASNTNSTAPDSHTNPPTSKRRNTFRKWLTNPVRKLSQNRIELGTSPSAGSATASSKSNNNNPAAPLPANSSTAASNHGSSLTVSNKKPPAASVNAATTHVTSSSCKPPKFPSAQAAQSPPLAQQEDWHEGLHDATSVATAAANLINKPSSKNIFPPVEATSDAANIINTDSIVADSLLPEMPPPMPSLVPALNLTVAPPHPPHNTVQDLSPSSSLTTPEQSSNTANQKSIHPTGAELAGQIENLDLNGLSPLSSMSDQTDLSKLPPVHEQVTNMNSLSPRDSEPETTSGEKTEDAGKAEDVVEEEAVPEAPQDPLARAVTMRDYVLRELVDTERDYVKDLGSMIDGYVAYMHENAMPDDMNGRDKLIFGNIQQIYVFHRDTFCGELEKCLDAADRLPQVFIRYERKFQMYVVYCQNKPKSEFIVSEYIDTYFEDIRLKLGHKLKLPDMLIKPVQRVMRYQLMLKDILKYTERAQLPSVDLQKALNCVMGVCKLANDFMEVGRLQGFEGKLTAQGKLLLQDSFMVCETVTAAAPAEKGKEKDKEKEKKDKEDTSNTNKFKERQIFVFEQVVIFSEAVGGGGSHKKSYSSPVYLYKSHIQVNKMSLIEVEKDVVRFALRSRCPHSGDRMFVIEAPDKEKRDYWVTQIKAMLDTQQNFLRALQSPIDFQRRAQQGDEVMGISGETLTPPPPIPPVPMRPPVVSSGKPPEARLAKFLRPKSYTEDRRRTVSSTSTRPPETPPIIRYGGSHTTPVLSPPPAEPEPAPRQGTSESGSPGKFLFPLASLKTVRSETDLTKKNAPPSPKSSKSSLSGSTTSLTAPDQPEKSRRWSISGRRDKSPSGSSSSGSTVPPQIPKESRSGLSFRKKN